MPRPKKTLKEAEKILPIDYIEHVISLCNQGASEREVFRFLYNNLGSLSLDLFYRWKEEEKSLSDALKLGKFLAQGYWEEQGRLNIHNREFNSALWYMNMKNRFGWSDNQNINHTGTIEHIGIIRAPEKKKLDKPKTVKIGEQTAKEGEYIEKDTPHKLAK